MPSLDDKSQDGEDPLEPPSIPQMHPYPFPHGLLPPQQPLPSKRRQVKNACTNCQRACKKCDDARPCLRCVKYGISEECVDSQRKERKKGIKRGPYKKRDGKGSSVEQTDVPTQGNSALNTVPPHPGGSPVPATYMPVGYPPGYYGQYPSLVSKQAEEPSPPMYPSPYYVASPNPVQQHLQGTQESSLHGYPPPQGFYQATVFAPVSYHLPQYDRPDVHSNQYSVYSPTPYPKHSTSDPQGEMLNSGGHHEQSGMSGKVD